MSGERKWANLAEQNERVTVEVPYPPALKQSYRDGIQFCLWFNLYKGHWLFNEKMFSSKQIPHSGRVKDACGFHEFFMGTKYIDAGYEALFYYRKVESKASYEKIVELVGGDAAARFIAPNSERGGRAPDLIVFDPRTNAFRFVECKGKTEPFTKAQSNRFRGIEDYLNQNLPPCRHPLFVPDLRWESLFPPLPPGRWIHVARLVPAMDS